VAAVASASLFGCGNPPPTPAPYAPTTVSAAWANHFEAFGAQDVDKIMLDYDDESVLQIFNDGCSSGVLQEFVGLLPIAGFFADLFETLTPTPDLNVPPFGDPDVGNPTVEGADVLSMDAANVFLVWQSVAQGIEKATDTFLWKEVASTVKVKKQNIVATQPNACPAEPVENPAAPEPDATSPVTLGWNNHFNAFGAQDLEMMMLDYTENSTVQVYTWNAETPYTTYEGLSEIRTMFTDLWAAMNAQTDVNGSIGLGVPSGFPRVEVDVQSVFLTWFSNSNPKATDTFLFDAAGKILRQTIVTTTGTLSGASQQVVV